MQSKYKSLGSQTLLALILLLALITGWLAEGAVRAMAWISCAAVAFLLARPERLAKRFPALILFLIAAMLVADQADTYLWIWALPLCLSNVGGRMGMLIKAATYAACVIYTGWTLALPTTVVASLSLAVVWLLCLERQRLSASVSASTTSDWLLPPAQLDADIHHERKRTAREALHSEVAVFGCARSTASDMEQLCRFLQRRLMPYERAYRLNDYGIAVILVTLSAEATRQRRQQLRYEISPHREVSSTPLPEIGDRFTPVHSKPSTRASEVQPWH